MQVDQQPDVLRFGTFELDLRARELRKNGLKLRLPEQSIQILAMLLARPGDLVTREEIQAKLWPDDTIVEFDHSINAAVKRLRQALGDSADNPRYVETLARRGYRFIAPTDVGAGLVPALSASDGASATIGHARADAAPATVGRPQEPALIPQAREKGVALQPHPWTLRLAGMAVMLVVGLAVGWFVWHRFKPQATQVAPGTIRSLAVLPLDNLSGDPQQEYFADGVTDALIADLGQIAALRVISRTSVMRYKGTKKALPEIARELGVDAIAEGSVVREGNRVRIIAQLVEGKTDRHLWAHAYERDLTSVLALQGEVAQAIADEIRIRVTPEEQARLARARPVNPEAQDLLLKGWHFYCQGDPLAGGPAWESNLLRARDYFRQACDRDPSYAPAQAALAYAYICLGDVAGLPSVENFSKAKAAAAKALELDDALADAHAAFAHSVFSLDWDWATAEREFKRALELNPNSVDFHDRYAFYLVRKGSLEEAISQEERAAELEPRSLYLRSSWILYLARQYDQALEELRRAAELDPSATNPFYQGVIYREKGMYGEAIKEFQKIGDHPYALGHMGNACARAGRVAEAHETIRKLKERVRKDGVGTYEIALVYAALGEKDQAFAWLENAYQVRDKGLTYLKVDPCLDPLRSDPRFQDLLRRVGLPP
jgi:TolB-like protein/DNA-binding winged helix-turn-helix (wHTH) protein/Tfp pilus assembly protein PilF